MANMTKKQLADDICKVLFGGDFVYADWSCFDPFNLEGKDTMAAFLTGLMYGMSNGKAKTAEYVRAQNYISFDMPDTETAAE